MTTKKAVKKAAKKSEQELINIVRQKAQGYLRLPNVTSVGVGRRIKDGKETDELSIQFTVGKKLSPERLALENVSPLPTTLIADDGTEVPVDIIERSYKPGYHVVDEPMMLTGVEAMSPVQVRRRRLDRIMPGISISHVEVTAGTFGAVVYDTQNGTPYILSNWHVLNGPTGKVGDTIVQPGTLDDGNVFANTVGRLVRSHLGIAGDFAIASIIGRGLATDIFEIDVTPRRIATVSTGDRVVKSGRTTGVTHGTVSRVGVFINLDYGGNFNNQTISGFEIRTNSDLPPADGELSMGGDSGSLWMIDTNGSDRDVAVGLHFAGETDPSPSEEHAVACDIRSVLEKLQVTFVNPHAEPQNGQRTRATARRR